MRDSEIPKFVYKALSEEKHAHDFLQEGRFRIGRLQSYKAIEDAGRRDSSEGEALYRFEDDLVQIHHSLEHEAVGTSTKRGLMNVSGSLGNPTYIFCTSLPSVDISYIRDRFGPFIVQINDPKRFIADMREALERTKFRFLNKGFVEGRKTEYSKGKILISDVREVASCKLAVYQKPPEFEPEKEFRFIALMNFLYPPDPLPEFVEVDLGKPIDYANLC